MVGEAQSGATAHLFEHGVYMTEKSEAPKTSWKSDDLIEPKANAGKIERSELSEHELGKVSGGYQTGGSGKVSTANCPTSVE
jgi:hypothetical protein